MLLAIGSRRNPVPKILRNSGFTLIELLIVILIIAIVTTVAVLSVGDFGASRKIETAADQFVLQVRLAEQQAILQPTILAITINNQGYYFSELIVNPNNQQQWQSLGTDPVFGFHAWPEKIKLELNISTNSPLPLKLEANTPQIIISPTGDITPFTLSLGLQNAAFKWRVLGSFDGTITLNKL